MTAFQHFWDEVWTAKWAADVAQGLLTTGLGLLGAYWFLYRQFKHDRELVREQAQADILSKLADEVGQHFIAASRAHPLLRLVERGELVMSGGDAPWDESYYKAMVVAHSSRPLRPPKALVVAHGDASAAWTAARSTFRKFDVDYDHRTDEALAVQVNKFFILLQEVGETYRNWDGFGELKVPVLESYHFDLPQPVQPTVDRRARLALLYRKKLEESLRYAGVLPSTAEDQLEEATEPSST